MSLLTSLKQHRWVRAYAHWLGKSQWRAFVGLYGLGFIGVLGLWGLCKLIVLLLATGIQSL